MSTEGRPTGSDDGIEEGTAAQSPSAGQGTGNPNRERPDVAPAQLSDDAIRENAARLEDEEDGAYAEE